MVNAPRFKSRTCKRSNLPAIIGRQRRLGAEAHFRKNRRQKTNKHQSPMRGSKQARTQFHGRHTINQSKNVYMAYLDPVVCRDDGGSKLQRRHSWLSGLRRLSQRRAAAWRLSRDLVLPFRSGRRPQPPMCPGSKATARRCSAGYGLCLAAQRRGDLDFGGEEGRNG